jgi:hypothetical protein
MRSRNDDFVFTSDRWFHHKGTKTRRLLSRASFQNDTSSAVRAVAGEAEQRERLNERLTATGAARRWILFDTPSEMQDGPECRHNERAAAIETQEWPCSPQRLRWEGAIDPDGGGNAANQQDRQ